MKKKKDTIDSKYHQQLREFQHLDVNRNQLQEKVIEMTEELSNLKKKDFANLTDEETERITFLKLEIPKIQEQLDNINAPRQLTNYYLNVGPTLGNYYQALETKNQDLPSFLEISKGEVNSDNPVQKFSQLYNAQIDPQNNYINEEEEIINNCVECKIPLELNNNEGLLVCPECLNSRPIVIHTDKPSYNDSPCDNIYFSYQRINHFREKLTRIQQRDNFKIPRHVEEKLCEMFLRIQEPFNKHIPADKTNFTSYNFVINKCLHIIGHPEFAKHFPLLKSKENLYKAEIMWKKICQDLKKGDTAGGAPPPP